MKGSGDFFVNADAAETGWGAFGCGSLPLGRGGSAWLALFGFRCHIDAVGDGYKEVNDCPYDTKIIYISQKARQIRAGMKNHFY